MNICEQSDASLIKIHRFFSVFSLIVAASPTKQNYRNKKTKAINKQMKQIKAIHVQSTGTGRIPTNICKRKRK